MYVLLHLFMQTIAYIHNVYRFFTIKWWVGLGAIEKLIAESDFIFDFNSINSNDRQLCLHDKFVEIVGHVTINDSILQEPHINPGILFVSYLTLIIINYNVKKTTYLIFRLHHILTYSHISFAHQLRYNK